MGRSCFMSLDVGFDVVIILGNYFGVSGWCGWEYKRFDEFFFKVIL